MPEPKMITLYRGNPITELSREELIEALEFATSEINRLQKEVIH